MKICFHHHQFMLAAQISQSLSHHPSLSSITPGVLVDCIFCPHRVDIIKFLLVSQHPHLHMLWSIHLYIYMCVCVCAHTWFYKISFFVNAYEKWKLSIKISNMSSCELYIYIYIYIYIITVLVVGFWWTKYIYIYIMIWCYVLGKGHKMNKTNMDLERRIKFIYYCKQVIQYHQCNFCYLLPWWITIKCFIFIWRVHHVSKTGMIDLVWFYGISTIAGYLMPNPFLYLEAVLFQTIRFSKSTQFSSI